MDRLSPEEIFDGIRREDRRILQMIYHVYYPSVLHYIKENSGNEHDAQDIFQDAMVIVYLKVKKSLPVLTCTFGTYLFSVNKYLWYKELRKLHSHASPLMDLDELIDYENNFMNDYIKMEKRKLVLDHFHEMGESCQKLLSLFIQNTPVGRITEIMGFSSDQYTRNRRTRCKERLVERIWNSPRYRELRNEEYREDSKIPRW
jgi:RNA polymerase sigma factor (sigma-70 family)